MTYDVVFVGAGHQTLVAAALLAKAGRSVLVVERNDAVGGCLRSGEATVPGLEHDLFATNANLFLASAAYAELRDDLARHGVAFATSDKPFAAVFPSGRALRVVQDLAQTAAHLRDHDARDADGFFRLHDRWLDFKRTLLLLLATPLPSARAAGLLAKAAATLGPARFAELAQLALGSPRELGDAYFATDEAKALLAPWGMHLDFGPDVSFGAVGFESLRITAVVARGRGASGATTASASILPSSVRRRRPPRSGAVQAVPDRKCRAGRSSRRTRLRQRWNGIRSTTRIRVF